MVYFLFILIIFQVIIQYAEHEKLDKKLWNLPRECEPTANVLQSVVIFMKVQHSLRSPWSLFTTGPIKLIQVVVMVSDLNSLLHPTFLKWTTESFNPSWWRMGFLISVFTFRILFCHQHGLLHSGWASFLSLYPLAFLWDWSCKMTAGTEAGTEKDEGQENGGCDEGYECHSEWPDCLTLFTAKAALQAPQLPSRPAATSFYQANEGLTLFFWWFTIMGTFTPRAILWSEHWVNKQKMKLSCGFAHEPAPHIENEHTNTFLLYWLSSVLTPQDLCQDGVWL